MGRRGRATRTADGIEHTR
uniref:Uncharacterized protein n=1 Tax=Arundo donax TaxID=35708 RepID=A0A0A9G822_ARUDO